MRIRRIKLSGFKSFVDPAELRIEPGLTGIVGPNGCGKSNLLEAIRWAMGEGSAKSLRGGGMEDVIFAGTARRPARDFAEVSILLDRVDADGLGNETEVARRIERGAGSAYRIDGRDVRQKDVALLFADAATGAHSPALVSQGRIGAIIAARPDERRAMLEEAAGISGLHVRRRDAELKLRATEANLERLEQIGVEQEARIAALRRQARAAERYRALTAAIRIAEGRLIYARWREAATASADARRDADAADATVVAATAAHREAADRTDKAVAALGDARGTAQGAREAAGAAGHRRTGLEAERARAERRIAEVAALAAQLAGDRAREGALAEDAAAALARIEDDDRSAAARIAEATARRPTLIARMATVEGVLRDAEVALAQALGRQAAEQAEMRVATAALAAARRRLERAEMDVGRVSQELAALNDGDFARELDDAVRDRADAVKEADAASADIASAEGRRAALATERDTAQAAAASARAALASLDAEAKALARSLGPSSGARVLDAVTVAPGYERALAAALGDDLAAPAGDDGPMRWAGAAVQVDDPPLPAGCECLADHVEAPPALARRLAQIGVQDVDDRATLAPGQRMVTRAGALRRWDGFIVEEGGSATAEALLRRNRLTEIERLRPGAADMATSADADVARLADALRTATGKGEAARRRLAEADGMMRTATQREARARAAIERVAARRAELVERGERAAAERAAALQEADEAGHAVAALAAEADVTDLVGACRTSAETTRADAAGHRVELAALDGGLEADTMRRRSLGEEARGWRARAGEAARRVAEMAKRADAAAAEAAALAGVPQQLAERIAEAGEAEGAARAAAEDAVAREREADGEVRAAEARVAALAEAVASAREARATAAARFENQEQRRVEMGRIAGERFQCPAAVLPATAGFDSADIGVVADESARFERLGADRERIGPVNLVADQELAAIEADRAKRANEQAELAEAVARLRGSIGTLNREGRQRLRAAFEAVDGHFRRLFTRLFAGGEAHLALIDSDDPLEAGLEVMAQPPGKRLSSLTLLSGGEQALTACALIFALFLTNPAPICVLDEVDAPLDDANIERFCDLLDQMTRETATRYLVVTHNAVTMARMHRLFGVTMIERGVSRLVSVDLGGAEHLLAAE